MGDNFGVVPFLFFSFLFFFSERTFIENYQNKGAKFEESVLGEGIFEKVECKEES